MTALATPWDPGADREVLVLAPIGPTIYAGGHFTNIGGQDRSSVAALDATGLATPWDPSADGAVRAFAFIGETVYVAGGFMNVGGAERRSLAGIDPETGTADDWDPSPNGNVLALSRSGPILYAGGSFFQVGDQPRQGIARFLEPPVSVPDSAGRIARLSARPNPFRTDVALTVDLERGADLTFEVFDIAGRRVWSSTTTRLDAGRTRLRWDGGTTRGGPAAPGVYFLSLRGAGSVSTERVVRID